MTGLPSSADLDAHLEELRIARMTDKVPTTAEENLAHMEDELCFMRSNVLSGEELQQVVERILEREIWIQKTYQAMLRGGNRMTASQPVASPERIAAVTELPPLDVTEEDKRTTFLWDIENTQGMPDGFVPMEWLACRERQLLAALADVRKFEDADASQAAEMAALRSAKEKAEAEREQQWAGAKLAFNSACDTSADWQTRAEAAEAENTRLRDALKLARSHVEIIFGPTFFTTDICIGINAALSVPGAKREG